MFVPSITDFQALIYYYSFPKDKSAWLYEFVSSLVHMETMPGVAVVHSKKIYLDDNNCISETTTSSENRSHTHFL